MWFTPNASPAIPIPHEAQFSRWLYKLFNASKPNLKFRKTSVITVYMSRRVVDAIKLLPERPVYEGPILLWVFQRHGGI